MAWVLQKGSCPIVGLNSIQRIEKYQEAFNVELTDDEMKSLEEPFHPLAVQVI